MQSEINKMQRHIRISDVIDTLMSQSLQLMDIVNKNQTDLNGSNIKTDGHGKCKSS